MTYRPPPRRCQKWLRSPEGPAGTTPRVILTWASAWTHTRISTGESPVGEGWLAGRLALVTGASRGIGAATAAAIAAAGAHVVLAARDRQALDGMAGRNQGFCGPGHPGG